jgi:hypothetical protein
MFYPYSSGYHIPSSPSFPGAWSSAWSLPQQHLEYEALEAAEIKRLLSPLNKPSPCLIFSKGVNDNNEFLSSSDYREVRNFFSV